LSGMKKRKVVPSEAGDQTRERILGAAEELFARSGFDGVSMRDIGAAAEVPYALVTYHFKSKLGVYQALFRRRQDLLTNQRAEQLRALQLTGNRGADIRAIAAALVEPLIRIRDFPGGEDFARLIAREICDPRQSERGIMAEFLDPVAHAALDVMRQVAPEVSYARICWAFHLATGALAINNANTGRLERLSAGEAQASDADAAITELTAFITSAWMGMLTAETPQARHATRKTKHRSPHRDSALPREPSRRRA
jgi:AcrR family transcriptional regulator